MPVAQAGSSSPSRAEPSTATRSRAGGPTRWRPSAGDKLKPHHSLLRRKRDDDPTQHPLAVLAAWVQRKCSAHASVASRLVDVAVEAEHRLVAFEALPHGRRAYPSEDWRARADERTEFLVQQHCGV